MGYVKQSHFLSALALYRRVRRAIEDLIPDGSPSAELAIFDAQHSERFSISRAVERGHPSLSPFILDVYSQMQISETGVSL